MPLITNLPNVTGECSASITEIPKAIDNCNGDITGVTNDPLTYTDQGTYTVTWIYDDGYGNIATQQQSVVVLDKTPPAGSVTATPNVLWPVNHKFVQVTIKPDVYDNCDANSIAKIISVTSSEPGNSKGDGNTAPDWQITGDLTVKLRAERSGNGNGRIYTITVLISDTNGNSTTQDVIVTVPHSKKKS